jgi:hypothetical protein
VGPFDLDFDELFERGLAALLDGFERSLLARPNGTRRTRARG